MPIFADIYGPVISRHAVAEKIVADIRLWLPAYIANQERQEGLPTQTIPLPPDPQESFKHVIDFDTWTSGAEPIIMVRLTPEGEPERFGDTTYSQIFNLEIVAVIQGGDEDEAQFLAEMYGAALMALVTQHGGLGTWANGHTVSSKTLLTEFPDVAFVEPEPLGRRLARAHTAFHIAVDGVITEAAGPRTPPGNPYAPPGEYGFIETVKAEFGDTF